MSADVEKPLRQHELREEDRCREAVREWLYRENSPIFRFAMRPFWMVPPDAIDGPASTLGHTYVFREFERRGWACPNGSLVHACVETGENPRPYFITNRPW